MGKRNEKKRKSKATGLLLTAAAVALLLLLGNGLGLGFGNGFGLGTGESVPAINENVSETEKQPEKPTDEATREITIEVKQGRYIVDGKELTLSDIEALVKENDAEKATYYLDDNYASTKAWDDIKKLFANQGVSVVEK